MTTVTIRCAPGRKVPLPDGTEVPAHGSAESVTVPRDMFINRRLADGDVVIVKPAAATKEG